MKKVFFVAAAFIVLAATSCKNEPRVAQVADTTTRDSLQKIIDQKDNEINDMMSTLNQIQEGFREIAQAENRVNIVKDGERGEGRPAEGHHREHGEATRGERSTVAAAPC